MNSDISNSIEGIKLIKKITPVEKAFNTALVSTKTIIKATVYHTLPKLYHTLSNFIILKYFQLFFFLLKTYLIYQ